MKTILLLFVQFTLINTIVFGQFIENKGQITTLNNVQFYWQFNNMTVYFQKDRAIFISSEIEYQDNEESLKMKERGDYSLAKKHSSVTTQHRFRSEERRVGKECRSRWSGYRYKNVNKWNDMHWGHEWLI